MRNHNTMKRDAIIKMIAGLVGQPHRVDLKNYDLLITVEIYQVGILQATGEMLRWCWLLTQNICGVSVVDHRFEELKRYNISEIFDPTPKEAVKEDKAEVTAEVEAEAVPKVADDHSGAAATDEVNDKVVEGDGGVSVTNDDATSRDKDAVSVVNGEVQADVPESSAEAPQQQANDD
jgi:hypothetical protein